jgi:hypothetical protein
VWLEGLGKLKKSTSSGARTGDLPACSIVPQPTMLPHACYDDLGYNELQRSWKEVEVAEMRSCPGNFSEGPSLTKV